MESVAAGLARTSRSASSLSARTHPPARRSLLGPRRRARPHLPPSPSSPTRNHEPLRRPPRPASRGFLPRSRSRNLSAVGARAVRRDRPWWTCAARWTTASTPADGGAECHDDRPGRRAVARALTSASGEARRPPRAPGRAPECHAPRTRDIRAAPRNPVAPVTRTLRGSGAAHQSFHP